MSNDNNALACTDRYLELTGNSYQISMC